LTSSTTTPLTPDTRLTSAPAGGDATLEIEGRQIKAGVNPDLLRQMQALAPLGRSGTPAGAAGAITMLCCPEANEVSGAPLVCGGGFRI
jgi:3-oxoacyl-[acyl-carrier protein] reductase